MVPEILESRKLFSVVTATQSHSGVLTITGTDGADTISVNEVTVPEDNPFGLAAGTPIVFVTYDADGDGESGDILSAPNGNPFFTGVKGVKIIGKAGNDSIEFTAIDVSSVIQGDAGDDLIVVIDDQDNNHVGSSIIFGGDGDDDIEIAHGNNTIAFGEAGNDRLSALLGGGDEMGGTAVLFGNAGDDIFVATGNVVIIGGAGHDTRIDVGGSGPIVLL